MKKMLNSEIVSQVDMAHTACKVYTLHDMVKMFHVSLHSIYNWMDSNKSSFVIVSTIAYIPEEQLKECLTNHQAQSLKREGGVK